MKKILLLGGSAQQVIAITTAKKIGYYTVLCDYLPDNPGQYEADKFYLLSTTDKEAVLQVAKEENIDGILAYASDPAAPTAAYVAEKMGLPTHSYESVEILCNKDKFRKFLQKNGFNAPKSEGYTDKKSAINGAAKFNLPIIVKPVDSSGSKGVTVLYDLKYLRRAVDLAFAFSRSCKIIIEEYIEKNHQYLVGGDIFIINGRVVLWGLLNCHRNANVNPLVPVGKSYPLALKQEVVSYVKETLQSIVDKLHLKSGEINVELLIDKNNQVWPIDIGPRAGGNMIPDLLGMIFNVNLVEMSVLVAMGEKINYTIYEKKGFYATHNLHSAQRGKYIGIEFKNELKKYIIKKCIYKKEGDYVEYFDNAANALGIIFLKFQTEKDMRKLVNNISDFYYIGLAGIGEQ